MTAAYPPNDEPTSVAPLALSDETMAKARRMAMKQNVSVDQAVSMCLDIVQSGLLSISEDVR